MLQIKGVQRDRQTWEEHQITWTWTARARAAASPDTQQQVPSTGVGQPCLTTKWSDASWTQVKQMPHKPLMFTGQTLQMFNPFAGNPSLLQTPQLWDLSTATTYAPTFFYTWVVRHQLESFCQDKVSSYNIYLGYSNLTQYCHKWCKYIVMKKQT